MVKRSRSGNSASGGAVTHTLSSRDRGLKTSQWSDERHGTTVRDFSVKEASKPLWTLSWIELVALNGVLCAKIRQPHAWHRSPPQRICLVAAEIVPDPGTLTCSVQTH